MLEVVLLISAVLMFLFLGYVIGKFEGKRQAAHGANFVDSMQSAAMYLREAKSD